MRPDHLIVALDIPTHEEFNFLQQPRLYVDWARNMVRELEPTGCMFKVGMQLAFVSGALGIRPGQLGITPERCMLDLKLWDMPDTVAKTAMMLGQSWSPKFFTVALPLNHASVLEARHALKSLCPQTVMLGVTVPTSVTDDMVQGMSNGLFKTAAEAVHHYADLAAHIPLDGLVCSAQDLPYLAKQGVIEAFRYVVTPGIRSAGDPAHDQKRVATPAEAVANGATHLVVGRPLTEAPDPVAAAKAILAETL